MLRGLISSERVRGRGEAAAPGSHISVRGGGSGSDAACLKSEGASAGGRL